MDPEERDINLPDLPSDIISSIIGRTPEYFPTLSATSRQLKASAYAKSLKHICNQPITLRELLAHFEEDCLKLLKYSKVGIRLYSEPILNKSDIAKIDKLNVDDYSAGGPGTNHVSILYSYSAYDDQFVIETNIVDANPASDYYYNPVPDVSRYSYHFLHRNDTEFVSRDEHITNNIQQVKDLFGDFWTGTYDNGHVERFPSVAWYYRIMKRRLSCNNLNPNFAINTTIRYFEEFVAKIMDIIVHILNTYGSFDDLGILSYIRDTARSVAIFNFPQRDYKGITVPQQFLTAINEDTQALSLLLSRALHRLD